LQSFGRVLRTRQPSTVFSAVVVDSYPAVVRLYKHPFAKPLQSVMQAWQITHWAV
jgi:hypothetical protein